MPSLVDKPSPELRRRLAALHVASPWIYWTDLFASAAIGWGALVVGYRYAPILAVVSALALLRAAYFIHELAHMKPLRGFALAWHVVAGIPLMVPALMIGVHDRHHRTDTYGTAEDPEYQPYAHWPLWRLLLDVVGTALAPPLLALRFGVIGPLSWFIPPLRRLTIEKLSTLGSPYFTRRASPDRAWIAQELACAAWVWTGAALFPLRVLGYFWLVAGLALVINQVRTLVAHAYENVSGPLDVDGQLLDTLTLSGSLLTELVAPLGDRYHAAHHRFPAMPYHNLGAAHRLLLDDAGLGEKYRRTRRNGVLGAVYALLARRRNSASARRRSSGGLDDVAT